MGLDEKALGTAAAAIAYGMTGVLSMIPALQEIRLERKLNEDKTKLEMGTGLDTGGKVCRIRYSLKYSKSKTPLGMCTGQTKLGKNIWTDIAK